MSRRARVLFHIMDLDDGSEARVRAAPTGRLGRGLDVAVGDRVRFDGHEWSFHKPGAVAVATGIYRGLWWGRA